MQRILTSLIAFFLLTTTVALAQENKAQDQKPTTPTTATETEKPKNEVERMLEDARERGDTVLGACITDDEECLKESDKITGGLEKGRVINLPQPPYPKLARMAHAQGTVVVQVLIGAEGTVIAAAVISGHPLLHAASVEAARKASFTPTLLNGKPVKVTGVIKYNFVAQ